ncbi:MAG: hypothetical protein ABI541_00995 [Betaproteobacteria bacterium]
MISCKAEIALACGLLASALGAQTIEPSRTTTTPIEHLIVVVGENISFDNLFATYEPPPGETVANLSGHPAYSTVYAFERFVEALVKRLQANPAVWSRPAIGDLRDLFKF